MVLSRICRLLQPNERLTPSTPGKQDPSLGGEVKLRDDGYRTALYYSSWSIYEDKHWPEDIPIECVTNLFYAFFNIEPQTGTVCLGDPWADTKVEFKSLYNPGCVYTGLFTSLFLLKEANRHLKTSMSIGGWSNAKNFKEGLSTQKKIDEFVESSLHCMLEYGFDGIDIDWEYPEDAHEAKVLLEVLTKLRQGLRKIEDSHGLNRDSMLLTIASPSLTSVDFRDFDILAMDQQLSFWNVMSYDMAGEWSEKTAYHCNLFKPLAEFGDGYGIIECADELIQYLISRGIQPSKLNLGIANYGRSFIGTDGLGFSFKGVGPGSDDAPGIWKYNKLPLPGTEEKYDRQAVVAYNYSHTTKTFVSYDNVDSVVEKGRYVKKNRLGGAMFWESSGDRYTKFNDASLLKNFVEEIGGTDSLAKGPNVLDIYKKNSYIFKHCRRKISH